MNDKKTQQPEGADEKAQQPASEKKKQQPESAEKTTPAEAGDKKVAEKKAPQPESAEKTAQQPANADKPPQPAVADQKAQQPEVAAKKRRRRKVADERASQPAVADTQAKQPEVADDKAPEPKVGEKKLRKRLAGIGVVALVLVLAGAATAWWFLIRDDDPSGTTADVSVSDGAGDVGGVEIVQVPSLAATATIDGVPADGPIDITFGSPTELVVSVLNDGNITMDDITVTLEFTGDDTATSDDPCELPALAPEESGDCTLEFTPTDSMTAVSAKILGYGPQQQEVELSVDVTFG